MLSILLSQFLKRLLFVVIIMLYLFIFLYLYGYIKYHNIVINLPSYNDTKTKTTSKNIEIGSIFLKIMIIYFSQNYFFKAKFYSTLTIIIIIIITELIFSLFELETGRFLLFLFLLLFPIITYFSYCEEDHSDTKITMRKIESSIRY